MPAFILQGNSNITAVLPDFDLSHFQYSLLHLNTSFAELPPDLPQTFSPLTFNFRLLLYFPYLFHFP